MFPDPGVQIDDQLILVVKPGRLHEENRSGTIVGKHPATRNLGIERAWQWRIDVFGTEEMKTVVVRVGDRECRIGW